MKFGRATLVRQNGAIAETLRLLEAYRVARTYAVILSLIGMLVVLARALKNGAGLEGTVTHAIVWMTILALVGLFVGAIAAATIDESVRTKAQAEIDAFSATADEQQA